MKALDECDLKNERKTDFCGKMFGRCACFHGHKWWGGEKELWKTLETLEKSFYSINIVSFEK